MKITMLLSNGFAPDPRVNREAHSLTAAGHEVKIIAWDRTGKYLKKEKQHELEIERIRISSKYDNMLLNSIKMPLFWLSCTRKTLFSDFDAIHCHDFDTLFPGWVVTRLRRKRLVYDAHDSYSEQRRGRLPSPLIRAISGFEKTLSRSAKVITVNPEIAKRFKKASVVMNCQWMRDYDIAQEDINSLLDRIDPERRGVVTYIGGLQKGRGLEKLLEIAKLTQEYMERPPIFVIAGRGKLEKQLKQVAFDMGLSGCILFPGFIEPKNVPLWTKASSIIYAFYENTPNNRIAGPPNKLFEAICAGVPVLGSKIGFLGTIIEGTECGATFGPADNPEKIAKWLSEFFANSQIRCIYAKNAIHASKNFNWETEQNNLLRVYG